jgi:hypothetical protein
MPMYRNDYGIVWWPTADLMHGSMLNSEGKSDAVVPTPCVRVCVRRAPGTGKAYDLGYLFCGDPGITSNGVPALFPGFFISTCFSLLSLSVAEYQLGPNPKARRFGGP